MATGNHDETLRDEFKRQLREVPAQVQDPAVVCVEGVRRTTHPPRSAASEITSAHPVGVGSVRLPEFIEHLYVKRFGRERPEVVMSVEERARAMEAKRAARKEAKRRARPEAEGTPTGGA